MYTNLEEKDAKKLMCHRLSGHHITGEGSKLEVKLARVNCIGSECMLWHWIQPPGKATTLRPVGVCSDLGK